MFDGTFSNLSVSEGNSNYAHAYYFDAKKLEQLKREKDILASR